MEFLPNSRFIGMESPLRLQIAAVDSPHFRCGNSATFRINDQRSRRLSSSHPPPSLIPLLLFSRGDLLHLVEEFSCLLLANKLLSAIQMVYTYLSHSRKYRGKEPTDLLLCKFHDLLYNCTIIGGKHNKRQRNSYFDRIVF